LSLDAFDAIVVGGAAAGLTAALYTSRQGLKALVVTRDIGGQAPLTDSMDNYPGFGLMGRLQAQAKLYGTAFVCDEAIAITEEAPSRFPARTYAVDWRYKRHRSNGSGYADR